MSFKSINNNDAPVFDKLPKNTAKGFFIRRLMSLAGKPVLAEKNLPIKPSGNEFSEKCYVNKAGLLYRQQKKLNGNQGFKPAVRKYIAPKNSAFDYSDREMNSFRHLSVHSALMDAVIDNRLVDLPPQVPIMVYPAADRKLFENRAKPVKAYTFVTLSTTPRLPGDPAKLNSIKFSRDCDSIARTAAKPPYAGMKSLLNWQPDDFKYPDSQLIFSASFSATDSAFATCLPGDCCFALFPGTYGFIRAEQTFSCNMIQNDYKARFVARPRIANESYDTRTEFTRNLVIICKTYLHPVHGATNARHSDRQIPQPSWSGKSRTLSSSIRNVQDKRCILECSASRLSSVARINSSVSRNLYALPELNGKCIRPGKEPFTANPLLNCAFSAIRSRIRLRLKLERACYVEAPFEPRLAIPDRVLTAKMTLPANIVAAFPSFVPARPAVSFVPGSSVFSNPAYVNRRSTMRFTSARHAHYCRQSLKKIYLRDFKKEEKIKAVSHSSCSATRLPHISLYKEFFLTRIPEPEAIKVIYLRSMPFLMKLTAMDFTDIFLPEAQRRAAYSGAKFVSDLSKRPSRMRNTLKSLRFKLSRITDGIKVARLQAQRRIPSQGVVFNLRYKTHKMQAAESTACNRETVTKLYKPGYRGRLEKFAMTHCVPEQIVTQMQLRMSIDGNLNERCLIQKHFISPAAWSSNEKPYKCRIKLTPHPFGFPEFLLPVVSFNLVEATVTFKYLMLPVRSLRINQGYALSREKVFLPPLSLKNPRRFLFPESIFISRPEDYYRVEKHDRCSTIKTPSRINSFAEKWGMQKSRQLSGMLSHRQLTARIRNKPTDNFTIDSSDVRYSLIQPPPPLLQFFMPRVKHLLLSCRQFFAETHDFVEPDAGKVTSACGPRTFVFELQRPSEEVFHKAGYAFRVLKPHQQKFAEKFTSSDYCTGTGFDFRHRPRIFRFPYQPEHAFPELDVNFVSPEEPLLDRLTFLDQISLNDCYLAFVGLSVPSYRAFSAHMFSEKNLLPESFSFNVPGTGKVALLESEDQTDARLDYEKARYPQKIDRDAFFKLIDISKLKMKTFKQIRSDIPGYLAEHFLPSQTRFSSRADFRTPGKLYFDSLHWVILLRSFIELTVHAPDYYAAKTMIGLHPRFYTVKASFTTDYHEKASDNVSNSLQSARKITHYALPTTEAEYVVLSTTPPAFAFNTTNHSVFSQTTLQPDIYECTGIDCELKMSISKRPEYRRNIELYILHMAMSIDDYDLFLGVSGRSLNSGASDITVTEGYFKHPHLPEWLDLPQTLVHRTKMRI